jgi:hypothetical protein
VKNGWLGLVWSWKGDFLELKVNSGKNFLGFLSLAI